MAMLPGGSWALQLHLDGYGIWAPRSLVLQTEHKDFCVKIALFALTF